MAVEQISQIYVAGVWHCLSTLLPMHKLSQPVGHSCPCVRSCNRQSAVPWACPHLFPDPIWPVLSLSLNTQAAGAQQQQPSI